MQTSNELPQQPGAAGAPGGEARRGADGAAGEQPLGANMSFNSTLMAALMGHVPSSDAPLTLDSQVGVPLLHVPQDGPPTLARGERGERWSKLSACSTPMAHAPEADAPLTLVGRVWRPWRRPESEPARTCWQRPPGHCTVLATCLLQVATGGAHAATLSRWPRFARLGGKRVHAGGCPGCTIHACMSPHAPPRAACSSARAGRLGEHQYGAAIADQVIFSHCRNPVTQMPTAAGAQPAAARPRAAGAAGRPPDRPPSPPPALAGIGRPDAAGGGSAAASPFLTPDTATTPVEEEALEPTASATVTSGARAGVG